MKRLICFTLLACAVASCSKGSYYDSFPGYFDGQINAVPAPGSGDKFEGLSENAFVSAAKQPVSTFSVDADGASYTITRRYLNTGRIVPQDAVRIEEFINYFTFDYAEPAGDETVAVNAEVGACPWTPEHRLVRLGLKGRSLSPAQMPASNYVFLVDVSGSMATSDKLDLLKKGLIELVDHLQPSDRISIVTYSGTVTKLLESTLVKDSETIKNAVRKLNASGATAGGEAMKMAYEEALEYFIKGGNNRVIMGTDGDFNVGVTSTNDLLEMVSGYTDKGVYLTVMGFGMGNLNDSMMETLSNRGNGTYVYVDCEDEITKVLVNEVGNLVAVASDAKVQVRFNPETVDKYRLIGYENRVMNKEDFDDDRKDAGEIGAGQTITALYEIIPAAGYKDGARVAGMDVRYKKALGQDSRLLSIDVDGYSENSENLRFASGVACFGLMLRNSEYKGGSTPAMASELVESSMEFDPHGYRKGLLDLIGQYAKYAK